jgi:hypothetical protein
MLERNMNRSKDIMMRRMLTGLTLFLWVNLSLVIPAIAQPPIAQSMPKQAAKKRWYTPSKNRRAPKGRITTTATRGCPTAAADANRGKLVALAPVSLPGQTSAAHPTFAWYVPNQNTYGLTFQLAIAQTDFQEVIYATRLDSRPGMMQLTLPETETGLTIGQSYSWRVILHCAAGSPSADQLVGGEVEVVASDRPSWNGVSATDLPQKYAESGLWYEAFAIATPAERQQLLTDLMALEQADPADRILKQSEALQQVIQLAPTAD